MVEALILLLLIVANGVFAMSEIAVVSTRKLRLRQLAEGGDQAAATALQPSENPNRFLATAQIGITLMGIFAGAFGSASFAAPLATLLSQVPWLTPHSEVLAVVLVVLVITYVSLVLGELVPKRIGLNNPEQIAMTVAGFMNGLSKLATPFVRLLGVSTEAVLRLLRIRHPDEPSVSDEEITGLMAQGREAGVFEETEHDIVSNIFWLSDRSAASLMLPRRDIVWLEVAATPELIREALKQYPYNRFVVAEGSLDTVRGFVDVRRLLSSYLEGDVPSLQKNLEPPLFFAESTPALVVLERFRDTGVHFGLVIDEYGRVQGLITLNNLLETLVEAPDDEAGWVVQREDGSWLLDGLLNIDTFKEQFDLDSLPGEGDHDFRTLGGFIVTYLNHIPKAGTILEWQGFTFEVVDMDVNRVDKVLLNRAEPLRQDGSSSVE